VNGGGEQNLEEWQTAGEILIKTAEGRDFLMHARMPLLCRRAVWRSGAAAIWGSDGAANYPRVAQARD
jgi:hypothetical protein